MVAKIAALATQEIPGVQAMGKSLSRTFGTIRAKVPGASQADTQGVSVEVGERQAAVDIDIVVEYGHSIVEVAEAIRQNVIDRIEGMTGLEVVEVNVGVDDLHLEGSDDDDSVPCRVSNSPDQLAKGPANQRGQIAAAIAAAVDTGAEH